MASNYDLQVDMAKKIFLTYDQNLLIRKFSLASDEDYLYLTYLGSFCRIDRRTGSIEERVHGAWQECRSFGTVMTVYDLLCYHKGTYPPCPFRSVVYGGYFRCDRGDQNGSFHKKVHRSF